MCDSGILNTTQPVRQDFSRSIVAKRLRGKANLESIMARRERSSEDEDI